MLQTFAPLIGRILLALIFIFAGFHKLTGFEGTAGYMASHGLPMPQVLLIAGGHHRDRTDWWVDDLDRLASAYCRGGDLSVSDSGDLGVSCVLEREPDRHDAAAKSDESFHEEPGHHGRHALHHCVWHRPL